MALRLRNAPVTVVGAVVTAWCALDTYGEAGTLKNIGPEGLDALVSIEGFAESMRSVGWLEWSGEGPFQDLQFPDYEKHNGPTAKSRALTALRVRNHRQNTSVTSSLHDRTKNKNKNSTPKSPKSDIKTEHVDIPDQLKTASFAEVWAQWVEVRSGMGRSRGGLGKLFERQLRILADLGPERAAACLRYSITNGYQGIFPERFADLAARPVRSIARSAEDVLAKESAVVEAARAEPLERWFPAPGESVAGSEQGGVVS
jgi:hypothetical protein